MSLIEYALFSTYSIDMIHHLAHHNLYNYAVLCYIISSLGRLVIQYFVFLSFHYNTVLDQADFVDQENTSSVQVLIYIFSPSQYSTYIVTLAQQSQLLESLVINAVMGKPSLFNITLCYLSLGPTKHIYAVLILPSPHSLPPSFPHLQTNKQNTTSLVRNKYEAA